MPFKIIESSCETMAGISRAKSSSTYSKTTLDMTTQEAISLGKRAHDIGYKKGLEEAIEIVQSWRLRRTGLGIMVNEIQAKIDGIHEKK